jgi:hypothetical protein
MDLTSLSRMTTTAVRNAVQPGWRNQAITRIVRTTHILGVLGAIRKLRRTDVVELQLTCKGETFTNGERPLSISG